MSEEITQQTEQSPCPETNKGDVKNMTREKPSPIPESNVRIWLAVIGLIAFIALLIATVVLASMGQQMPAIYTGTGAVAVGVVGFYKMLLVLGRPS